MIKRNRILAGLLALQIVLGALVFAARSTPAGGEGKLLFPGVSADQIVRVTIAGGQDAAAQSVELEKREGNWVLPAADDYPCQAEIVTALLAKIVALKAGRAVAETATSHARLKVADDEFERRLVFELADGTAHTLYLGSSPSYGAVHVRAGGQDAVYLAPNFSAEDARAEASAWVDPAYFSVEADQLAAIVLENSAGQIELVKDAAGKWALRDLAPGETMNDTAVQSLLNSVSSVSLSQPLGKQEKPEYGLDAPLAVLTLRTAGEGGEKTYTLRVGAQQPGDQSYVLASSESPYVVRVSQYAAQGWVEKTRADLLQPPPTAAPTPAP